MSISVLGNDDLEQSRSVLFLLAYLLICVNQYSYEEAQEYFNRDFIAKYRLNGLLKRLTLISSNGSLPIFSHHNIILYIIYNDLDLEQDLLEIYRYGSENSRKNSYIYTEYQHISRLLNKSVS